MAFLYAQVLSSPTVIFWWNPLIAASWLPGWKQKTWWWFNWFNRFLKCAINSETLFINRVDLFADYRQSRLSLLLYFRINLTLRREPKILGIIKLIFCVVLIWLQSLYLCFIFNLIQTKDKRQLELKFSKFGNLQLSVLLEVGRLSLTQQDT